MNSSSRLKDPHLAEEQVSQADQELVHFKQLSIMRSLECK